MFVGGVALLASRVIGNRGALPLEIHAVAHQWWWEFDYPKLGVRVADEFYIPEGRRVRLELTSADVLHSFWLPPMKLAADVVPG
jgi:cytochrome c oxidase subunit 2